MLFRLSILFLALCLGGCQPNTTRGEKGGANKNPGDTDGGEGEAEGGEDFVDPSPQKDYCETLKDSGRGNLPEYLYTAKEACNIKPWALSFKASNGDAGETRQEMKGSEEIRAYMEDFLNRAAKIDALKPGRKFHVRIMEDDDQNAYADGRQNIVINSSFLKNKTDPEHLLGVLCHEMSHSLRNDASGLEDYYDNVLIDDPAKNPKAKAFYDKADAYFVKTYDDKTSTYTHDKAAFDAINPEFKQYKKAFWVFSKRVEATADVIGGGFCVSIGMKPASFRGTFEELKADEDKVEYRSTAQIQDGESFEIPPDQVFAWVFSDDSHPSYVERIDEIKRVAGFLGEHVSEDTKLMDEWNQKFPALLKKAGFGQGVALTDEPKKLEGQIQVKNLSTGEMETFRYRKSHGPHGYRH